MSTRGSSFPINDELGTLRHMQSVSMGFLLFSFFSFFSRKEKMMAFIVEVTATYWFIKSKKPDLSDNWEVVKWPEQEEPLGITWIAFVLQQLQTKGTDSCVVQHDALIKGTVKSHRRYWVQTQDFSMCFQQQSTAVRKQEVSVVWGIRRYALRSTRS